MARKGYMLRPMMELEPKRAVEIAMQCNPVPQDFMIVTSRTTDDVTGNDSIVWEDELMVDGYPAYFGMGFAVTREMKALADVDDKIASMKKHLRLRAWQDHELIRLGYYKWVKIPEPQEENPDASDVA